MYVYIYIYYYIIFSLRGRNKKLMLVSVLQGPAKTKHKTADWGKPKFWLYKQIDTSCANWIFGKLSLSFHWIFFD